MIRNKSLSTQITIIFIAAFIITSLILGGLIIRGLGNVFEYTIYKNLESEGKALRLAQDKKNYEKAKNIEYILYQSSEKKYTTSDNISRYLDQDSIKLLINKAAAQEETSARYVNTINGKEIFYVVLNYEGFFGVQKDDVFIILTDNTMKMSMARDTSVKIIIACLIAFAIGYMIIFIWISRLVDDTKKITKSLSIMGNNHYKTKLTTKRSDEIGELVENIELMRDKIIRHEKQKQDIIQGVSHDLKTPIALIQSYAEALEDDMCDKKEMVDITLKQCQRLNSKVTKLLNITRLGYIDVNKKSMGVTQMDDMMRELVSSYSYQTKVDIELNIVPASFVGDKESWIIAVQNILDNALRFADSKIIIDLKEEKLSIFNDGKNIDEEYLPNIFSAYEKTKNSNFGLGLSIVKRTVDLFGYCITAENLDSGVCFTIVKNE